jgi:hypothetical protein
MNCHSAYPREGHTYAATCCEETLHAVAQLVEALRYKPEGRGFD